MITTHESCEIFANTLLLTCICGPVTLDLTPEEVAFQAGLNL